MNYLTYTHALDRAYRWPQDPERFVLRPHAVRDLSGISDGDWERDGTTVGPLHRCDATSAALLPCRKWGIVLLRGIRPDGRPGRIVLCGSHFTQHRNGRDTETRVGRV